MISFKESHQHGTTQLPPPPPAPVGSGGAGPVKNYHFENINVINNVNIYDSSKNKQGGGTDFNGGKLAYNSGSKDPKYNNDVVSPLSTFPPSTEKPTPTE
ncbi:hypothetical protein COB52_03180 [Candidatus Kaiserbacteria bacterium]|nr:MAG: hypothetical protein COB52_03180 [Candidatus Kaiserbacteria bacterium]